MLGLNGTRLSLTDFNITNFPEIPEGITELYCNCLKTITKIPKLPNSLINLCCIDSNLNELPEFNEGLRYLTIMRTNITKLPKLPSTLYSFSIEGNISELPELPIQLKYLLVSRTNIRILPQLSNLLCITEIDNSNLIVKRKFGESIIDYENRWIPIRIIEKRKEAFERRKHLISFYYDSR